MDNNNLDFIIIGAQKSATTSLYKYLNKHPSILMPASKEAPFFVDECYSKDNWPKFSDTYFSSNKDGKLWGKATPQYMADKEVPARIHELFPKTKLIAILRDPIDRAWSHYRMDLRRETETRDFDQVIQQLLDMDSLRESREKPVPMHRDNYQAESDFYITWGEYGRILSQYLHYFESSQLLVLSMSELQQQPEAVMDKVLTFLNLEPGYRPAGLGEVAHKGGGKSLIPREWRDGLKHNSLFRGVWGLATEARREQIRYWYDQLNVRKSSEELRLSADTASLLRSHFANDLQLLQSCTNMDADWMRDYPAG